MKSLSYLKTKTYDWRGWNKFTTRKAKAKRALQQFTPESWTPFEWGATRNLKRWFAVVFVLFVVRLPLYFLRRAPLIEFSPSP